MLSIRYSLVSAILGMAFIIFPPELKGESEAQRSHEQFYISGSETNANNFSSDLFIAQSKIRFQKNRTHFNAWLDTRTTGSFAGIRSIHHFQVPKPAVMGQLKMDPGVKWGLILGLSFLAIGFWFGYTVGYDENNDTGEAIGSAVLYGLLFGLLGAVLGYGLGKLYSKKE